MSRSQITAPDTPGADKREITGKKVGSKRGMHTIALSKNNNTVEAVRTDVMEYATKINLPEDAKDFIIYHLEAGETVSIGKDSSITGSVGSAPIESGYRFEISLDQGNENNLYGVASTGTITVYAIGVYRG